MAERGGIRLGREAAARLAELACCEIGLGSTEPEFERIEKRYGFEFADEHRAVLAAGLPVRDLAEDDAEWRTWEKPWPDWRDGAPEDLQPHLDRQVDDATSRPSPTPADPVGNAGRGGSRRVTGAG
ncbi:hypothetical protein NLM24_31555 [Nocardia zapadnayensis]|uniref:hypothetical protein n=1 Tax=Nocardia rhamnosiphila TaxID=426716 RepID=UPI0022479CA3|nr:hypothetical protein [Nocardia zapadnayensis]MCX0275146.1 hypothetical protein [Nocardia zapadnayensis]